MLHALILKKLQPLETMLTGNWFVEDDNVVADDVCRRNLSGSIESAYVPGLRSRLAPKSAPIRQTRLIRGLFPVESDANEEWTADDAD